MLGSCEQRQNSIENLMLLEKSYRLFDYHPQLKYCCNSTCFSTCFAVVINLSHENTLLLFCAVSKRDHDL